MVIIRYKKGDAVYPRHVDEVQDKLVKQYIKKYKWWQQELAIKDFEIEIKVHLSNKQ